jgi:hypothetical protein
VVTISFKHLHIFLPLILFVLLFIFEVIQIRDHLISSSVATMYMHTDKYAVVNCFLRCLNEIVTTLVQKFVIVAKLCFFNLLYYCEVRYPISNKGNQSFLNLDIQRLFTKNANKKYTLFAIESIRFCPGYTTVYLR